MTGLRRSARGKKVVRKRIYNMVIKRIRRAKGKRVTTNHLMMRLLNPLGSIPWPQTPPRPAGLNELINKAMEDEMEKGLRFYVRDEHGICSGKDADGNTTWQLWDYNPSPTPSPPPSLPDLGWRVMSPGFKATLQVDDQYPDDIKGMFYG